LGGGGGVAEQQVLNALVR